MSRKVTASLLTRGIEEIISKKELEKQLASGKKLRIKHGVDPTTPDLHLGHAVCHNKLREFQELGHKVIFLIGNFTAKIGDPSGRNTARPVLSDKEIKYNYQTYLKQAGKILDIKKCEIVKNSQWYNKMDFSKLIKLISLVTLARVTEREDFQKRIRAGNDIGLNEVLYPVMQGYDSVELQADVEVGGADQKLNMLMAREIQKKYAQVPQVVLTIPLLIGIDGTKKMSKSFGNYISLNEDPYSKYSKIMSIADKLIPQYFELAARTAGKELEKIKKEAKNPQKCRDLKASLAREIVAIYNGAEYVSMAEEEFNRVFKYHQVPLAIPEIKLKKSQTDKVYNFLVKFKLVLSKSEAKRLISQNGVKIDKTIIDDSEAVVSLHPGMIFQVGKRKFIKINLK